MLVNEIVNGVRNINYVEKYIMKKKYEKTKKIILNVIILLLSSH